MTINYDWLPPEFDNDLVPPDIDEDSTPDPFCRCPHCANNCPVMNLDYDTWGYCKTCNVRWFIETVNLCHKFAPSADTSNEPRSMPR